MVGVESADSSNSPDEAETQTLETPTVTEHARTSLAGQTTTTTASPSILRRPSRGDESPAWLAQLSKWVGNAPLSALPVASGAKNGWERAAAGGQSTGKESP